MSVLGRRSSAVDAAATATAARAVVERSPRGDLVRRRWGRIGGGVLLAVLGGWLAVSLYLSADERVEVLMMANGVARLDAVQRGDLRVVRLSADSEVATIPAARLNEVVGRVAATELPAGVLLADSQLFAAGTRLVSADEAIAGLLLGAAEAPAGLERGAAVSVVVRYSSVFADAATAELVEVVVPGWVAEVGGVESAGGGRSVAVVVPAADAAVVSAASAEGRVSLVMQGG